MFNILEVNPLHVTHVINILMTCTSLNTLKVNALHDANIIFMHLTHHMHAHACMIAHTRARTHTLHVCVLLGWCSANNVCIQLFC